MAWTMEIYHIDVGQGDSTLIVAREVATVASPLIGAAPVVRSLLIDGGRANKAADVNALVTGAAGLNRVDVIAVTHYDADHYLGISALLTSYAPTYNNAYIFDQGWPGGGLENQYIAYLQAINGTVNGVLAAVFVDAFGNPVPPARTRITKRVLSFGALHGGIMFGGATPAANTASVPAGAPGTIDRAASWLVGREILWTDNVGAANNVLWGGNLLPARPGPGQAGGPPAVTCIACNAFVSQVGGNPVRIPSAGNDNSQDAKNGRSLTFVVVFQGFRYYIGGDLSSVQEDGGPDDNGHATPGLGAFIQNQFGQVHAMKASHHGSGESSSAAFLTRLDPVAAFISCGVNNNFGGNPVDAAGNGPWPDGHPQQRVLESLEARMACQSYYLTADRHNEDFCRRLNNGNGVWPAAYTPKGVVAGAWGPPAAGWGAAPGNLTPCASCWPNDGADQLHFGTVRIVVDPQAALGPPRFQASYTKPRIDMPVLSAALTLPANVVWPNGQALPAGTILPAGAVWPAGAAGVLDGMTLPVAFTLIAAMNWPNGRVLPVGVVLPGGAAAALNGFSVAALTILPAGVTWDQTVQLPVGTILPAGCDIPAGIVSPNPPDLEDGEILEAPVVLPAGVRWPNGAPLPTGASLPINGAFPAAARWPAGTALPALNCPNGTQLAIGTTLPQNFVFPVGSRWPANQALPRLLLPAGVNWPNGQALPANTILPQGARLPAGVTWPNGGAVVFPMGTAPTFTRTVQH